MFMHNRDQGTDCTETCPAYGTPQEALVDAYQVPPPPEPSVTDLRLIAQSDQNEAATQAETREEASWRMHLEQHEAAAFHNNALGAEHLSKAHAYEALAELLKAAAAVGSLVAIVRAFRRQGR